MVLAPQVVKFFAKSELGEQFLPCLFAFWIFITVTAMTAGLPAIEGVFLAKTALLHVLNSLKLVRIFADLVTSKAVHPNLAQGVLFPLPCSP
jgi:hypothetical protein